MKWCLTGDCTRRMNLTDHEDGYFNEYIDLPVVQVYTVLVVAFYLLSEL